MLATIAAFAFLPIVVQVTPKGFESSKEPQVAIDADQSIYIAYGQGNDIYLSISRDKGTSYDLPTKVAHLPTLALGMRRGPRIVAHNGSITVTAISRQPGDLVAFRSTDKGKTWSSSVRINDVSGASREGLQALAVAPDGTLACSWLDLRSAGTKLFLSTSKDAGKSWSSNRMAYESPSGSICECCHPSLVFDSKSKLYLMFRNSISGSRNMYLTSTGDLGQTFTTATKLGAGDWQLNACPMDGGSLAITPDGQVRAVWRRENTIYKSSALGAEAVVGPGQQPWTALGSFQVWTENQQVFLGTPSQTVPLAPGNDPVISGSPDRQLVLAAWTHEGIQSIRAK